MWDTWPTPQQGLALFRRLCDCDPVAQSDLVAAYLDPLLNFLRGISSHVDDHLRLAAAEDALLAVIHKPTVYNPAKRDLGAFLRMAARADLANALDAEGRHHRRRVDRDCVELPERVRNDPADDLPSFDDPGLAAVVSGFSDVERSVLELMRTGERRTAAFAIVLGIEALPDEQQAREVKRVKDRIFKRLRRSREGS